MNKPLPTVFQRYTNTIFQRCPDTLPTDCQRYTSTLPILRIGAVRAPNAYRIGARTRGAIPEENSRALLDRCHPAPFINVFPKLFRSEFHG